MQTGKCSCRIKAGGRQCNLCPPRNWGFPLCRPCRCNGHDTSNCHPKTGVCLDCQHNTAGKNCEVCATGYYGDATTDTSNIDSSLLLSTGTPNDCRRCQCPGGSSGNQFSNTCGLSGPASSVCDACDVGYSGTQCEECDDGYYGNPLVPGGRCQPCSCNNNIDPAHIGNCDKLTGRCLACLYNTAGFSCERCKSGYYGDAIDRNCTECVCNSNGTDPGFIDTCNYETGQCKCLPNVVGTQCDMCADGFWNLGSGAGCNKCDCCGGSTQATCNESSLFSLCALRMVVNVNVKLVTEALVAASVKAATGEHRWATVNRVTAIPRDPSPSSVTVDTGKCQCKQGMVGETCDQCDVDTTGKMPQCEVCGECYYQWKVALDSLSRNISVELPRALNISLGPDQPVGSVKAYSKELQELEEKLKRVEMFLENQVTTENETTAIEQELDSVNTHLRDIQDKVNRMDKDVTSTEMRTTEANIEIERLRERLANLLQNGTHLKSEIEQILRSDITRRIRRDFEKSDEVERSRGEGERIARDY
ncbi:hypothetical protein OS493_031719 [Desmophyllum pertusum]|uniref:Laminin EGF-like domain-containing protein n=1 Tax=Desmophyllum pertusum TaxID=174260 RepID=A0A9W9ZLE0_9CNID|nr:hypothetical protein OS493_031719 [Desmophyllum pertusum]